MRETPPLILSCCARPISGHAVALFEPRNLVLEPLSGVKKSAKAAKGSPNDQLHALRAALGSTVVTASWKRETLWPRFVALLPTCSLTPEVRASILAQEAQRLGIS